MKTWWERYPERLEWELEALRKVGFDFELDEAERARGRIVLQGTIAMTGEGDLRIIIAYPDTYPHTRVSLYAPDLRLPRHQNPSDGNLGRQASPARLSRQRFPSEGFWWRGSRRSGA